MSTAGIVLAAGDGSRLGGRAKALLPHRGRPLLHTVTTALADGGCDEVIVVLGAYAGEVAAACPPDSTVVVNPEWSTGMSTSLRRGVDAAGGHATVALTVVDFPGITAELVRHVLGEHHGGTVTLPVFDDRPGHPVVFDRADAVAAARQATADEGARSYLAHHRDRVRRLDCTTLADAGDVDTVDDLHRLEP
ncbi:MULTISPECIES: nucleotidyltransferase family protein [unclassified Rhodococcus (in: high G+C Gram-positive bacteria)]|uniref:nucleotidyltransferase family protein n=1 Tax=unclassified Rhodococcus (in: high G+C Gram-positive bacteria) TaxID=192944 RepID=UPI00146CBD6D|nr:nucleotidyltransferase family protein [Rhodococcus sp. 105337]NME79066.1 nucleotidyltransferase family protein [Rhodococcus sp. 105337]